MAHGESTQNVTEEAHDESTICDSTVRATFMNLREISVRSRFQEMDLALGSQCMTNCKFCHKRTSRQFYWCLSTARRCGKNSFILFLPCINTLIIGQVNASSLSIKFGGDERPCVYDMREVRQAKGSEGRHNGSKASSKLKV